jgi:hypothetical protein
MDERRLETLLGRFPASVRERVFIRGAELHEVAYGWTDLTKMP